MVIDVEVHGLCAVEGQQSVFVQLKLFAIAVDDIWNATQIVFNPKVLVEERPEGVFLQLNGGEDKEGIRNREEQC